MLIWRATDHIFTLFQTVLSQKHIIACHNIYSPALLKMGSIVFFSFLLKDKRQRKKWWIYYQEADGDSTRNQRFVNCTVCWDQSKRVQHAPICRSTSAEGLAEVHRTLIPVWCLEAQLHILWRGAGGRGQGVAEQLARRIQHCKPSKRPHSQWKVSQTMVVPLCYMMYIKGCDIWTAVVL